jgi:hypothetical protein
MSRRVGPREGQGNLGRFQFDGTPWAVGAAGDWLGGSEWIAGSVTSYGGRHPRW